MAGNPLFGLSMLVDNYWIQIHASRVLTDIRTYVLYSSTSFFENFISPFQNIFYSSFFSGGGGGGKMRQSKKFSPRPHYV